MKKLIGDTEDDLRDTFFLRELLLEIARSVEFAEAHAQDTLYGLNLFKLAMSDKEHFVKKCALKPFSWASILQRTGVKAVFFCDGVGDLVIADSCCPTLPCRKQYLAVDIDCLKETQQT